MLLRIAIAAILLAASVPSPAAARMSLGFTKAECGLLGGTPDDLGGGDWACCFEGGECWNCRGETGGPATDHCICLGAGCPAVARTTQITPAQLKQLKAAARTQPSTMGAGAAGVAARFDQRVCGGLGGRIDQADAGQWACCFNDMGVCWTCPAGAATAARCECVGDACAQGKSTPVPTTAAALRKFRASAKTQ